MSEFSYVNETDGRLITIHEEIYDKYREKIPEGIHQKHKSIERKFNFFYWGGLVGVFQYAGFKFVTRKCKWAKLTSTPFQTGRNIFLMIFLQFYLLAYHIVQ